MYTPNIYSLNDLFKKKWIAAVNDKVLNKDLLPWIALRECVVGNSRLLLHQILGLYLLK